MPRLRAVKARRDTQPMRFKNGAGVKLEEHGKDALVNRGLDDVPRQVTAKEQYAIPTPIAQLCWKVTSPNGREELREEPIPGFEHLCSGVGSGMGGGASQGTPSLVSSPDTAPWQLYQPTVAQAPAISRGPQHNTRKRRRSTGRGLCSLYPAQTTSDDDDDNNNNNNSEQYGRDVTIATEQSYTFYIGDIDELKRFFRRRLDELTMKPVRPIVTAWIKQLEPKRLSRYGPYHKKLAKDQPPECTPPWWPRDVPYEEPSHLDKGGLLTLAVDVILQHRLADKDKRKAPWVAKLRQAAQYAVETTPPDQFSSSKGSGFSERMQARALAEILPNLFEIAQLYEDHFAYWKHYEGSGNPGPGKGTHVTWKPLTRPARQPNTHRKRLQRSKASSAPRSEVDTDTSGDETEVDDTVAPSYQGRQKPVQQQTEACQDSRDSIVPQQAVISSREDAVAQATQAPVHDGTYAQGGQRLMYPSGHSSYHDCPVQARQGASSLASMSHSNFVPACMAGYQHPYPAFDSPYPHAVDSLTFYEATGLPYEYGMYAPPPVHSFDLLNGMPNDSSISCQVEAYRP